MKNYIIAFVFCVMAATSFSQNLGTITITDLAGANQLVETHVVFNKNHSQLPGFRIQVISSPKLQDIKDAKSNFIKSNPDLRATIVYETPNYKLRIGNYQNRFDANSDLQEMLTNYPNAFICKDLINVNNQ